MNINPNRIFQLGQSSIQFDLAANDSVQYSEIRGAALQSLDIKHKQEQALELQRLSNQLMVPTTLNQIHLRLRLLGHPIHLFGETISLTRQRLKVLLMKCAEGGLLEDANQTFLSYLSQHQTLLDQRSQKQREELITRQKKSAFLTESQNEQELYRFRLAMLQYSFASAQLRLKVERKFRKQLLLILDAVRSFQHVDLTTPSTIPLTSIPTEFRPHVKKAYLQWLKLKDSSTTTATTTIHNSTSENTMGDNVLFEFNNNDQLTSNNNNNNNDDIFANIFDDFIGDNNNNNSNNFIDSAWMNNTFQSDSDFNTSFISNEQSEENNPLKDKGTIDNSNNNNNNNNDDSQYQIPTHLYWQEKLLPTQVYQNRRHYTTHHLAQMQELRSYTALGSYKADTRVVSCSALNNELQQFVTGSWAGHLKLWDLNQIATLPNTTQPEAILLGHNGRIIDVATPVDFGYNYHGMYDGLEKLICSTTKLDITEGQSELNNPSPSSSQPFSCISSGTDGLLVWPTYNNRNGNASSLFDYQQNRFSTTTTTTDIAHQSPLASFIQSPNEVKIECERDSSINSSNNGNGNRPDDNANDSDDNDDDGDDENVNKNAISPELLSNYQSEAKTLANTTKLHPISRIHYNANSTQYSHLNKIAIHPNNNHVFSTAQDHSIKIFDLNTNQLILDQFGHSAATQSIALHQDGSMYCSGDTGGNARVWDTRSGRSLLTLEGHNGFVLSVDFGKDSSTSHLIATGSSDNSIKLWDLRIRKCIYTISTHKRHIVDVKFSPTNGNFLASASFDGSLSLFSLSTMSTIASYLGHQSKLSRVHWWDAQRAFRNHHHSSASPSSLLSPPLEQYLISSSFDTTFKVWGRL